MSNVSVVIKMCYVHNQWYAISCATLYVLEYAKQEYHIKLQNKNIRPPIILPTAIFDVHIS